MLEVTTYVTSSKLCCISFLLVRTLKSLLLISSGLFKAAFRSGSSLIKSELLPENVSLIFYFQDFFLVSAALVAATIYVSTLAT
jgi:hypothetical protein